MGKNFVSNNFKYFKNSKASGVLGHVLRAFKENKNAFAEYTKDNFGTPDLYEKYKSIYQQVNDRKAELKLKRLNDKTNCFIDGAFSFSLEQWEKLEKEHSKEKLQKLVTERMNKYMANFKKEFGFEPIGFQMHLDEGHEKNELIRNIHAHVSFFNYDFDKDKAPLRDMKKKDWAKCQDLAAEAFADLGFQRGISKGKTKKQHLEKDAFIADKQAKLEAENKSLKQSNGSLREDNHQLAVINTDLTAVNNDLKDKLSQIRETGKKAQKDLLKVGEKGKKAINDVKTVREILEKETNNLDSLNIEKSFLKEDIEELETRKNLEEKELRKLKKNNSVYEMQMNKLKMHFQILSRFFGKMVNTFKNLLDIERSNLQAFEKRNANFIETEELNNSFINLKETIFPESSEKYTVLDNCINNAINEIDTNDKYETQVKNHIQTHIPTVKPKKSSKRKPKPNM